MKNTKTQIIKATAKYITRAAMIDGKIYYITVANNIK